MSPIVDDPTAWKAADVADPSKWTFKVTDEMVKEIDAALEATKDKEIFSIAPGDTELAGLSKVLNSILSEVEGGVGFAVLSGLPVERWGEEVTKRALWILGRHLGWAEVQDKAGSLIHDVKDHGMKPNENSTVRYFQTNVEIPFHTDGCDIFALCCFSQGASGGRSRLSSATTAFNEILKRRPDLAKVLQEDFYFDARGQRPDGKSCQVHPIFSYHNGKMNMLHKVPYIESAQRLEGVPKLTALQREALDVLDAVMNEKEHVLEFDLHPGEIALCTNHSVCHGRSAFEDMGEPGKTRYMMRLWLTIPNGRMLPPHYADTREYMHTYTRRMPNDISVMDGSMGRLLMNSGVPQDDVIWSGRSITEEQYHPKVIEAHMQYIMNGSDLITTNNYTVQPNYYRKAFPTDWESRIPQDSETAARLAKEAVAKCNLDRKVRIMGCLPPICDSHRPDLTSAFIAKEGEDFVRNTYRSIGEGLIRGGPPDCFIAETMNTVQEAQLAIDGVKALGLPIIVSLEGALRNNNLKPQPQEAEALGEMILKNHQNGVNIEALSFNCAPPEDILACIQVLNDKGLTARLRAAGIVLAVYANLHDRKKLLDGEAEEGWSLKKGYSNPLAVRKDLAGEGVVVQMQEFVRCGVSYVGACCGSTPEQIGFFTKTLDPVEENGDSHPGSQPRKRRKVMRQLPTLASGGQ